MYHVVAHLFLRNDGEQLGVLEHVGERKLGALQLELSAFDLPEVQDHPDQLEQDLARPQRLRNEQPVLLL